jgi:hypothetical protein
MTVFLNGVWRQNARGLGALMLLAGFAAFYYYPRPPIPFSEVEGTYSNPCCSSIRVAKGAFLFEKERVPLRLAKMKFGLVAHTEREIVISSGHRVESIAPSNPYGQSVLFDDDHHGFRLFEHPAKEYHFVRQ